MQQQDSYRLVVRRGPQPNQSYEITGDITTLGRDIGNDIVINDRETSRQHLRVLLSSGVVSIEDLGSTNGTFVNGKRVSGVTALNSGDMIGLGETVTLGFEVQRAPSLAAAESGDEMPTPPPMHAPASEAPYAPAQPSYGYQTPAEPFAPAQNPQMQQPGYYGQPPAGYQMPAPPAQYGYEYDPYAAREEGGGSQWLIVGCFLFFVLSLVCFGFVALIDQLNLWCDLPLVTQVVSALGYCGI